MFNMKSVFLRALLALSLAIGAAPAFAGPTYKVSFDTSTYSGPGFLDLQFLSGGFAGLSFANVSNLSGDFGTAVLDNATGDLASGFRIANDSGFNAVYLQLQLGGMFGFDVSFDGADLSDGITFSASLLDENEINLFGDLPLVIIDLSPGVPPVLGPSPGAEVAVVPEPSDALLMLTGLALLGFTLRRRSLR